MSFRFSFLLQMTGSPFQRLNNIPLYLYSITSLSVHPSTDTYVFICNICIQSCKFPSQHCSCCISLLFICFLSSRKDERKWIIDWVYISLNKKQLWTHVDNVSWEALGWIWLCALNFIKTQKWCCQFLLWLPSRSMDISIVQDLFPSLCTHRFWCVIITG